MGRTQGQAPGPRGRTEPRQPCRGRPPSRVGVAPASAMTAPPNPVPELVCGLGSNWNRKLKNRAFWPPTGWVVGVTNPSAQPACRPFCLAFQGLMPTLPGYAGSPSVGTLPPSVGEFVRHHTTTACPDIQSAEPVHLNRLFPVIIKIIVTRILNRYSFTRIVVHWGPGTGFMVGLNVVH